MALLLLLLLLLYCVLVALNGFVPTPDNVSPVRRRRVVQGGEDEVVAPLAPLKLDVRVCQRRNSGLPQLELYVST